MESLERKDASAGTDEPIKSEEVAPSPDTSERSNGSASPPPHCSICLGKLINTSFTDSCLHQFCFTCLLQWAKIKTECPLCKQTFKSIIHNVRSEEDYDQYHVPYTSQVAATLDVTADIHIARPWNMTYPSRSFMYRTTLGASQRYGLLLNPQSVARHEQIPATAPEVSSNERRRRTANPIDYRRTVYRHGLRSGALPDAFGRFRDSSAEYYRCNPREIDRLVPWLNRELQVLLNDNQPHIAYVLNVITAALTRLDILSDDFRNLVQPYFSIHTNHFIHELYNYARTNFDLVGYDQAVVYFPHRGLSNEFVNRAVSPALSSSSTSSSDSDVRVLDRPFHIPGLPSTGPHIIDAAGPSSVGQVFRIPSYNVTPDVLTISSTSSSSENECEVIGYVKPRHERTPEIIDLSTSEDENTNTASQSTANQNDQTLTVSPLKESFNQPSTSSSGDNSGSRRTRRYAEDIVKAQMYEYLNSTSLESNSEESDSDYNPSSRKSRRHKSSSKKVSKSSTTRKLSSRKRKKSATSSRKRDKTRTRALDDYSSDDNESPQREVSSSRGVKRYLSKSSDDGSYSERPSKKTRKNKRAKVASKKSKKRPSSNSSCSKLVSYESTSYSSSSSCSDYDSKGEENKKSNRRKRKKSTASNNPYTYTSEDQSANDEKSSSKSSSKQLRQRKNSQCVDSDLSDHYTRSASSRRSSIDSFSSRKNLLTNDNTRHCSSDDDEEGRSSSSSDDEALSYRTLKISNNGILTKTNNNQSTTSVTAEQSTSEPTTSVVSSSKNDQFSSVEHSVTSSSSSKVSHERRRSHKKRKGSKKRRRSHS